MNWVFVLLFNNKTLIFDYIKTKTMAFIIFIIVVCLFILFSNISTLKKENNYTESILDKLTSENIFLKKELSELKKSLEGKTISQEIVAPVIEEIKIPEVEIIKESISEITIKDASIDILPVPEKVEEAIILIEEKPVLENVENFNQVEIKNEEPIFSYEEEAKFEEPVLQKEIIEEVYVESAFSKFIKNAEKQFADNWTGILGTAIMVLGIGYLSIYTALKVAPLFRILILWLYAGLLVGSYFFLQKKEKWATTGLWLRSAGASLFLFGCFGASQIPALTFLTNPISSYALIGFGIAVNLFIGYIIKKQTFLSLHVILSMLILCVIPEKTLATILLAAITATIGIILSYKEKWEYHLLIVITAFIIFDIWFNAQGTKLSLTENIFAILGIITVAGSCMFMQYRSVYENTYFDRAAFITHLTNWILFATGLILHSTGSKFKTFVLLAGAVICFFIAIRARKKKVFWLYHLDGMISFILFGLSAIMLSDWKVGYDVIACILYLLVIICLFVVYKNREVLLHKIFLGINHVGVIALLIFSALLVSHSIDNSQITNAVLSLSILAITGVGVAIFSNIKKEFLTIDSFSLNNNLSLNGLLSIPIFAFLLVACNAVLLENYFYFVLIAIAAFWCALKMKFDTKTFDLGRFLFFAATIVLGIFLIFTTPKSYIDISLATGFLFIIIFNWKVKDFFTDDSFVKTIAIISVNALLLLLSYKYLSTNHIIQIFSWFAITLLNHEFLWINFKRKTLSTHNQVLLSCFCIAFSIIGSFIFLRNTPFLTTVEIGLIAVAISVIEIYLLFSYKIKNKENLPILGWENLNGLNSEFILFNALVFGFTCIQIEYITIYLSGLAIITFVIFEKFEIIKRYNIYSFVLLLGSIILTIYLAFNEFNSPDKTVLYSTQLASILLSIGYGYLITKSTKKEFKIANDLLPYIQNIWVIILLFIQVEINYLPLIFITLALLNFYLILNKKIEIDWITIPAIGLLAILVSVFYSIKELNNFTVIDWTLQLSSVALAIILLILMNRKKLLKLFKIDTQIILNIWVSIIMFSQLEHKWLPVFWAVSAILNLYLYFKKISSQKNTSIVYYLLANLHLGFLSFNFYESKFLAVYLLIFALLATYIYLAYKWMEDFKLKNSLLVYPATLSIGCFLYLTFDKGILTFFWILEALGLLILGIILKEKYFRYVSLSLVGLCVVRLMFFDLSNADFLIRALVLLGVGVVLLVMNSLFKRYKERFD